MHYREEILFLLTAQVKASYKKEFMFKMIKIDLLVINKQGSDIGDIMTDMEN